MSDKNGCGEGCRTYVDETVAKAIIAIIVVSFIVALVYGVVIYEKSINDRNQLSANTSLTEIVENESSKVSDTDFSGDFNLNSLKNQVRITTLNKTGDYVELKNFGTEPVNLSGWRLADKNGEHIFTFPDVKLKPQQTITIYSGADASNKRDLNNAIIWTTDEVWDDSDDKAALYDNSGKELDIKD